MLTSSKVRKRTAKACTRACKRSKTGEQSTHNEIDSILQEYAVCRREGDNGEKMEGEYRGTEHGRRL
jgi:hypothetical protein